MSLLSVLYHISLPWAQHTWKAFVFRNASISDTLRLRYTYVGGEANIRLWITIARSDSTQASAVQADTTDQELTASSASTPNAHVHTKASLLNLATLSTHGALDASMISSQSHLNLNRFHMLNCTCTSNCKCQCDIYNCQWPVAFHPANRQLHLQMCVTLLHVPSCRANLSSPSHSTLGARALTQMLQCKGSGKVAS